MKREKLIYLALISLIVYLALIDKNIFGNGDPITKTYDLAKINLTQIDLNCEVYLTRGDNKKLVIEAPPKILNKLSTIESNGILKIGGPIVYNFFGLVKVNTPPADKIKIFINHNQLDRIIVSDDAKIISVDYKQMSYHASNYDEPENRSPKFDFKELSLSNLGLINIFSVIMNDLN